MKKIDRIRTAKTIALALANQTPFEQWEQADKDLASEGGKLEDLGSREYRYTDSDGQAYVLVAQKKQVIQYDSDVYKKYKQLDWHLASAKTQEDVYHVAEALDAADLPASLKKIIENGIEQTITAMWHDPAMTEDEKAVEAHKVEAPNPYDIPGDIFDQTPEKVETPKVETPKKPKAKKAPKPKKPKKPAYVTPAMKDLAAKFEGVTFTCKGEGCCIWAEGDKAKHGKALEKEGFVWSGKRNAYYRKAA